jgi:hypothetical protein
MAKPKLVKLPASNANITPEGTLIKVNDGLFVLVENKKRPHPIYDIGDKVIVNGHVEVFLQTEKFPYAIINHWVGHIWEDRVDGLDGLYRIGWDADTTYDRIPEDFKKLCAIRQIDLDMIVVPEEHLTLCPSQD